MNNVLYIIIDILLVSLVCFILYKWFKTYNKASKLRKEEKKNQLKAQVLNESLSKFDDLIDDDEE